ncbi:MAG: exodeoxyribonuclease I [Desulfobacterales bacterium]|nr:exodeoxyribonuclease I [Desulfobacterales bacterium]
MKNYLFYDVETSGLNPAFDQVLTFACILTDLQFNEIQRKTITVRLRPDVIPSPHAFITHRLKPSDLVHGVCEFDAAREIHALLNRPNTQSIGYNSLGFDDDFLRFMFYRNLLDPYAHQYANGCSRGDILPLAALYRVFGADVLHWPVLEDGKPTLKLEFITQANAFETSGKAHEAMADVEALVALTKAFAGKPEMWAYAMGFFDKNTDMERLRGLDQGWAVPSRSGFKVGIMVSPGFGAQSGYLAPVLQIGNSIPYKNQTLWLRLDQPEILDPDEETGLFQWFVIRKRPGDQWLVLPTHDRFVQRLLPGARDQAKHNLKHFQENQALFLKTVDHHQAFKYPDVPNVDLDSRLYQDGFFSYKEKADIAKFFAEEAISEKIAVCESMESPRVKNIALRIIHRNYPDEAGEFSSGEFQEHLDKIASAGDGVVGYKGDIKYALPQCRDHMDDLMDGEMELDPEQVEVLSELKDYIDQLF